MPLRSHLDTIFSADREARRAEARLLDEGDDDALADLLARATREALDLGDGEEAILRLERLADLCAQIPGPAMVDSMIAILGHEEPSVRVAAGEALLDVGYERYAEVARGVERALEAGSRGPAMSELPYVLSEIGEPSALPLIRRFLDHPEADAVAAGIEALAMLGEPDAIADLSKLTGDARVVAIDEFEQETTATIGELAQAAIHELEREHGDG